MAKSRRGGVGRYRSRHASRSKRESQQRTDSAIRERILAYKADRPVPTVIEGVPYADFSEYPDYLRKFKTYLNSFGTPHTASKIEYRKWVNTLPLREQRVVEHPSYEVHILDDIAMNGMMRKTRSKR